MFIAKHKHLRASRNSVVPRNIVHLCLVIEIAWLMQVMKEMAWRTEQGPLELEGGHMSCEKRNELRERVTE